MVTAMDVPFYKLKELTFAEKDAVSGYRDLTYKQHDWMDTFPSKLIGDDCFAINGCLRNTIKLSPHDEELALNLALLINSAIDKSIKRKEMVLYRGYTDPKKMSKLRVGNVFEEEAFISSTSNKRMAQFYAMKNKRIRHPIISICKYPTNTPMLYIDEKEDEYLLQPQKFFVKDIYSEDFYNRKGKVYTIEALR